ncbi:hypothetical protein [Gloeothece verrucosa]|uniref:Uncharacterized protein n=1 Tax=Gloeothece verrucosa (strain PCC 7822) TaxID=497965 RepID=E0UAE8_GLOV7|nr:hypothetical protein [Gloeothece verrucosa]ADN12689.1 conserved hypothetical protein [Gloeothece verrucosa PCC 7822]
MNKQPTYSKSEDALVTVRSELLSSILEEEFAYSWNQDALSADLYVTELEDDFALCDCLDDEELTSGADQLFSNLHQCWSQADHSVVKLTLWERFGQVVPSHQLDKIMDYAQNIASLNLSPLEQLIQCVKPLLSHWSEDDLQIFARPLVYAMRGTTELRQAPWDELSEIDQVRLTMKIAQEAIVQFQKQNSSTLSESEG